MTNEKLEDRGDPKLEQDSGQLARDDTQQVAGTSARFYDESQDSLAEGDAESSEEEARASQKVGETVAEKYRILGLLGLGGMSAVFRAEHILTNKIVALKLMHGKLLNDANSMRRFQQEARAASRMTHPNAVAVHDMGLTDAQPYLVMDYLEGVALSTVIRKEGKLGLERAIKIFIQACSALDEAHRLGIIHRDLKPSNIMLVEEQGEPDFVKLVDFGIAKILSQEGAAQKLTTTGEVFGSPMYMSPEQCAAKPLDSRSDVYSMGCLMYESVCGKPPFEGENIITTLFMQLNEPAPPLKGVPGDASVVAGLNRIIQKTLAKDPSQRYQSIGQVRDELIELQKLCGTKISPLSRIWLGLSSIRPVSLIPSGLRSPSGLAGSAVGLICLGLAGLLLSPDYGLWKDPSGRERVVMPVPITYAGWDAITTSSQKDHYKERGQAIGLLNLEKVALSANDPRSYQERVNVLEKLAVSARADGDLLEAANRCHEALLELNKVDGKNSMQAADLLIFQTECLIYAKKFAELKSGQETLPDKAIAILFDLEQQETPKEVRAQACLAEYCASQNPSALRSQLLTVAHLWAQTERDKNVFGLEAPLELTYHLAYTAVTLATLHSSFDAENRGHNDDVTVSKKILADAMILLRPLREKLTNPNQSLAATYDLGALLKADAIWKCYDKDYGGAEADLREAEKCLMQTTNVNDSSESKVLFDLSDLLWKQKSWWDAIQMRARARQLWNHSHDRVIEDVSQTGASAGK